MAATIQNQERMLDCIVGIRSEYPNKHIDKNESLNQFVEAIQTKQIPTGDNLDFWVNECIKAIEKGKSDSEFLLKLAKKIGKLGEEGKLTADQIDRFVKSAFKIIEVGCPSPIVEWKDKTLIIVVKRLNKAEKLTSENKELFKNACDSYNQVCRSPANQKT